ncbi:MAG: nucleotidyltransferase domain-containing protein [Gammaproteobacteria bacterium]
MESRTIDIIRNTIANYPKIRLAIVFGSVATQSENEHSDIDLAVLTDKSVDMALKKQLIEDLALQTGRSVDLVDIGLAGQPLLGQILTRGKRISGSNTCFAQLLTKNLLDRADFLPYHQRILRERRQAWIGM